jgi:hypothetical protein
MTGKSPQPETDQPQTDQVTPNQTKKAVFRIPRTAFLAIAFLVICMTPFAFSGVPGLQAFYLVPLILLIFVQRTQTVATENGLAIRTVFTSRVLSWSELKGLVLTKKARVRAVLTDDNQVALPTIRTRHLPVLSLISGGRLPDPSGLLGDLTKQTVQAQQTTAASTSSTEE